LLGDAVASPASPAPTALTGSLRLGHKHIGEEKAASYICQTNFSICLNLIQVPQVASIGPLNTSSDGQITISLSVIQRMAVGT